MSTFQIRIKSLRENKGLSQKQFADDFGVAQSTVGGWESGKREPNYETTIRLAKYFDVTTDFLLGVNDFSSKACRSMLETDLRLFAQNNPDAPFDVIKQKGAILSFFDNLSAKDQELLQENIDNLLENAKQIMDEQHQNLVKNVLQPYIKEHNKAFHLMNIDLDLFGKNEGQPALGGELSDKEKALLENFESLNEEGRERLLDYSDDLVQSGKYIKHDSFGLAQEA